MIVRQNRFVYGLLLAWALSGLVWVSGADAVGIFTKSPYIQGPTTNSIRILWESKVRAEAVVRFGQQGTLDREQRIITVVELIPPPVTNKPAPTPFYLYEAYLEGLKPAESYSYVVELAGAKTSSKTFKTLDPAQTKITFIAYGDSRSQPDIHTAMARQFKAWHPDFILHTGDLVANGKQYDLWSKEFFTPLANVMDEIPLWPVIGNHENDGKNYLSHFHFSGTNTWYSFDVGPVHFLALDYQSEKAGREQYRFASNDLFRSQAPWKIVFMHVPMFNVSGHGSSWGHLAYLPLFRAAKTDMIIAGHSHLYERFRPMAPSNESEVWPITHVTTGGGGAPLVTAYSHPSLVVQARAYHYMVFEVESGLLKAKAIDIKGTTLDQFEIAKTNGNYASDYLKLLYPEEELSISLELAKALTAKVSAKPSMTNEVDAVMTFRRLEAHPKPLELEVGLTAESAKNYIIEPASFRVKTPGAKDETQKMLVKVRPTGAKKITGSKGSALSPALVFEAKIPQLKGDNRAFGQPSTLSSN
jgi:predicted phosphodiesterase